MNARTERALKLALEVAVPVLLVVAWQLVTNSSHSMFFPPPSTIVRSFRQTYLFAQFGSDVVPTLVRIGVGFGIGTVLGVAIGLPLGLSRRGRLAVMPHVEFGRNIPPPALLPVFVLLLGIHNTQKFAFIAFFCLFPVLLNTLEGVRSIDPTLLDTARSYGVPRRERIRRVVLPAAMPQIFAGMRNSISLAVIMVVLAEYYASSNGVGFVLNNSKQSFTFLPMWATILMIGILGVGLNGLFRAVEWRALAWHRGWRRASA